MRSDYDQGFVKDMGADLGAHYLRWFPYCREATLAAVRHHAERKRLELARLSPDAELTADELQRFWVAPFEAYLTRSGKMLRPYLVCLCLESCGIDPQTRPAQIAIAEMIHSSSLMLDDIADDSLFRRGEATAHQQHGIVVAGAAASAWFNLPMEIVWADAETIGLETSRRLLAAIAWEHFVTGLGTTVELTWSWQQSLRHDPNQYLQQVVHRSTSYTYRLPLKIGAITAGMPDRELAALTDFGEKLGLAFQLVDDILNVRPSDSHWGKETAEDVAQGKITLQVLFALQLAAPAARERLLEILARRTHDPHLLGEAVDILESSGALDRSAAMAVGLIEEAQGALDGVGDDTLRRRLHAFADYVVRRSR